MRCYTEVMHAMTEPIVEQLSEIATRLKEIEEERRRSDPPPLAPPSGIPGLDPRKFHDPYFDLGDG